MKRTFLLILVISITAISFAQIKAPVSWKFAAKKINSRTYEVRLMAQIDNGWHIYSQTTPEGGPIPTTITFTNNPLIIKSGPVKETGKLETRFEKIFGVDVRQYSNTVEFLQTVLLKPGIKTTVSGNIQYMTCNDEECLPPKKQTFAISLK